MAENIPILDKIKSKITDEEYQIILNNFVLLGDKIKRVKEINRSLNIGTKFKNYYSYLEQKQSEEKECCCSENEICLANNKTKLKKCKNFKNLKKFCPSINFFFNKPIQMHRIPHVEYIPNFDEKMHWLLNLLCLSQIMSDYNQMLISVCVFEYMMENYYLVIVRNELANMAHKIIMKIEEKYPLRVFLEMRNFNIDDWIFAFRNSILTKN